MDIHCYCLEDTNVPKQRIIASRSFGQLITDRGALKSAIVNHTAYAAEKLRRQDSLAGCIQVFIHTNQFRPDEPQHHPACLLPLKPASADRGQLIRIAVAGVRQLYHSKYRYQKAGVMLGEIISADIDQLELFKAESVDQNDRRGINQLVDDINAKLDRNCMRRAAESYDQTWAIKRERLTLAYTTNWQQLAKAFSGVTVYCLQLESALYLHIKPVGTIL